MAGAPLFRVTLRAQTPTARAVRLTQSPTLDGRDDEIAWQGVPVTDDFQQFSPGEAQPARFRTAFKVGFDDRTLYVFVRAYDPEPDSIVALLSRRDLRTPSEWIKVVVDAYHDRRTGLQFMVNPAGVKRDASIFSDNGEDNSWDGVWDVATNVDAEGWSAEYAIPFSQLRFTPKESHVFGFGIWRDVARYSERDAWPTYRPSRATFASQLGDLVGIEGIGRNRRLEVMPYVVTKNVTEQRATGWATPQSSAVGLDIKAGVTSNITVDATFNPDFGQVEADPAVLNLTAFEVRFDERRPFFQEGGGLFRCNGPCEGIFYTRRVGRTPQLRSSAQDPLSTPILGAAKVTGRFDNGTQFGLVAVTNGRQVGANNKTIEPQTHTLVGRLVRDFRDGRSQIGTMVTGLRRTLDEDTEKVLRREAYTGMIQGYHRFAERWELAGYTGTTVVNGSEEAIARTQLSSVHFHQRPDHEEEYDPTRTSMSGFVGSLQLRRFAGRVRWDTYTRYASTNLELNDLGFVPGINDVQLRNQISVSSLVPRGWYRRTNAVASVDRHWTTGGLPTGLSAQLHGSAELANFWSSYFTFNSSSLGGSNCVSCARGGPALRQSPRQSLSLGVDTDPRRSVVGEVDLSFSAGDEGRSWSRSVSPGILARVASRTSVEMEVNFEQRTDDGQWVGNAGALFSDTTHYTFARLHQHILGVTFRANVTATPTLSLQLYAQPFVAVGDYSAWRELADPRAPSYEDRFQPYGNGAEPAEFNVKQFNSNAVVRWEYRPGSVLFLVWQQGRTDHRDPGSFRYQRDWRNLFGSHPNNTVLLKVSYWFNP